MIRGPKHHVTQAVSKRSLATDTAGASVMEFGLIAPVFIMMMMGLFDLGQLAYGQSVLNGAVATAARESALETGDTTLADAKVSSMVSKILPGANVATSRISYYDFADVERPEAWNDEDGDGDCNNGEQYTDENDNGAWDADVGVAGNGGANDVVIYTVTVKYNPSFATGLLPFTEKERTLEASTVKKNQPFADQPGYTSASGTCT